MGLHLEDGTTFSENAESNGGVPVILIVIGSIAAILCVIAIFYGVFRRRHGSSFSRKPLQNPTDFMNSLVSWDHSYTTEEIWGKQQYICNLNIFDSSEQKPSQVYEHESSKKLKEHLKLFKSRSKDFR